MNFLRFPRTYGNLKRFREIAIILVRYGFGEVVGRLRLDRIIPGWARLRMAVTKEEAKELSAAERLTAVFQELGPTFIKFGQLLATRPDLVPKEYVDAFSRLQDKVDPFPTDRAKAVIEESLERNLAEVFSHFGEEPVASGSIGQVHTARLADGSEVIVKVKRPGTDSRIRDDLDLLLYFAGLAESHMPELAVFRPREICEEFARGIRRELDFVSEASYTAKVASDLEEEAGVAVPGIHWEYVTHDVLVLERFDGVPLSDPSVPGRDPEERRRLAQTLAECFMRQYFITGLFHADPHPGNIFLLGDGRLGLIDFGQTGHLSRRIRRQLALTVLALADGDIDTMVDVYADLGVVEDRSVLRGFKSDAIALIDRYFGVPVQQLDFSRIFEELVTVAREHSIHLPRDLVLLGKSFATAIGVVQRLDPDFRFDEALRPYGKIIAREQIAPKTLYRDLRYYAYQVIDLFRRTPEALRDLMEKARSGNVRVIFHHEGLDDLTEQIERSSNRLSLAMIIGAVLIGSSMILAAQDTWTPHLPMIGETPINVVIAGVGFAVATVMGLALAWSIFRSGRL